MSIICSLIMAAVLMIKKQMIHDDGTISVQPDEINQSMCCVRSL